MCVFTAINFHLMVESNLHEKDMGNSNTRLTAALSTFASHLPILCSCVGLKRLPQLKMNGERSVKTSIVTPV